MFARALVLFSLVCSPALAAPPLSADAERAIKRAEAAATQISTEIDWAAADRARVPTKLSFIDSARIAAVPLPVLLPLDAPPVDRATLTQGPEWFTIAMHGGGVHVAVHGSHRAIVRPDLADTVKSDAPRVSRSHRIWSLAFERFGVAYLIDVECEAPSTDARCAGPRYIESLYASAAVVGGRP